MWSLSSFPGISAPAPCFPPEALSSSQPAVVSLSSPSQPGTSSPIWRAFLPASSLPGETFPPLLSTAVTALPTTSPSPSPLPQGPSWWDLQNKHPPALGDGRGDNYTLNAAKLSSAREKRPEAAGDNPFRGTLLPPTALSSASQPKASQRCNFCCDRVRRAQPGWDPASCKSPKCRSWSCRQGNGDAERDLDEWN